MRLTDTVRSEAVNDHDRHMADLQRFQESIRDSTKNGISFDYVIEEPYKRWTSTAHGGSGSPHGGSLAVPRRGTQ